MPICANCKTPITISESGYSCPVCKWVFTWDDYEQEYRMTGWRLALVWFIVVCLAWFTAIGVFATVNMAVEWFKKPAPVASMEEKQMMKYHGTNILYEDHRGQLYFYRNGQKVRF